MPHKAEWIKPIIIMVIKSIPVYLVRIELINHSFTKQKGREHIMSNMQTGLWIQTAASLQSYNP